MNNNDIICPSCGARLSNKTNICIRCGYNFNTQSNINPSNSINQSNEHINNKPISSIPIKSIILLIIAIVNIIMVVPIVYKYAYVSYIAFLLSGQYFLYFLLSVLYIIFSIVFLLKTIWNLIKYNNILRIIFKIVVVIIIAFIALKAFNRSQLLQMRNTQKSLISTNGTTERIELKDRTVLSTDDVEINVNYISYKDDRIFVRFKLNNKSDKFYSFFVSFLKVNDKEMVFTPAAGTRFSSFKNYVEPHKSAIDYVMYIWYKDLKKHNIDKKDIKKISLKPYLYVSENGDNKYEIIRSEKYIDLELK